MLFSRTLTRADTTWGRLTNGMVSTPLYQYRRPRAGVEDTLENHLTRISRATPLTGTQSQHVCPPPKSAATTPTPITSFYPLHRSEPLQCLSLTWDLRSTTKLPAPSAPLIFPGHAHGSSMTSPDDWGGSERKRGGGLGAVYDTERGPIEKVG